MWWGCRGGWRAGARLDFFGVKGCPSLSYLIVVPLYPEKGRGPGIQWRHRSVVAISPGCLAFGRGFRSPAGERVTSSCLPIPSRRTTRRSHQEEGPLRGALRSLRRSGCVEGWPGFSTGHPCPDRKGGNVLSPPACGGLIVQPSPRRREGQVKKQTELRLRLALASARFWLLASVPHFSFSPPGRRRDEGWALAKAWLVLKHALQVEANR
jgi:hypothetical protein